MPAPPISWGPIEAPSTGGGPEPLPPIAGGPAPLPPIGGGPELLPPIGGGPELLPPIGGGPELLPPIGGGPIEIPPALPSAVYYGTLSSWGNARGTFSFNVSLNGSTGSIDNAVFNMDRGSGEKLKATNGTATIQNGKFTIQNFVPSSTNIPAGQLGKILMTGGVTGTLTSGTWEIYNNGNLSVRCWNFICR